MLFDLAMIALVLVWALGVPFSRSGLLHHHGRQRVRVPSQALLPGPGVRRQPPDALGWVGVADATQGEAAGEVHVVAREAPRAGEGRCKEAGEGGGQGEETGGRGRGDTRAPGRPRGRRAEELHTGDGAAQGPLAHGRTRATWRAGRMAEVERQEPGSDSEAGGKMAPAGFCRPG